MGNQPCIFKIIDNSYGELTRTYPVSPASKFEDIWHLSASSNWYDLSVTISSDDLFMRRFAGHVETGDPSTSDPAIGRS